MNKAITFKTIKELLDGHDVTCQPLTLTIGDNALEITVNTHISLYTRGQIVDGVVNMCFVEDDDGDIQYCPYLREFAFLYNVILALTNLDLDEDAEGIWKMLSTTDIPYQIFDAIGERQIQGLKYDIDEAINYRKDELLRHSKLNALIDVISNVVRSISEQLSGMDGKELFQYLEENIPHFKEELEKTFEEYQERK